MRCWWKWRGLRSSSYSAVVTDRKLQVDVTSPASLLSSLLPLHNWSQINVIFELSWRREEKKWERRGERRHRLSPSCELLRKKKRQNGNNSVAFRLRGAQTTPRMKSVAWYETPWCLNVKKWPFCEAANESKAEASLSAGFRIIFSTGNSSPPSSGFFLNDSTTLLIWGL